ncbi:hypothetical protein NIES4102_26890 [Chondrocystis sp. NIES-4102]|nr:hypothetical protein NIES4102_26890 [Chondrocystis sp. NIES-4102]
MEDWQKQWWKQIEKTATDLEEFWVNLEEATESFVEDVSETVNSFIDNFHSGIAEDVENLIEVIITTSDEIEAALFEDWDYLTDDDFTTIDFHPASTSNNPACINCAHYHGQSYNGNLLVCAMHPDGWEDAHCPDWEKE